MEGLVEGDLDALGLAGEHEDDGALGRDDGERLEGRVEQEDPGSDREHARARRAPGAAPGSGSHRRGRVVARLASDHLPARIRP